MGACSCVLSDNLPNKTVDITSLQDHKLDIEDKNSLSKQLFKKEKEIPIGIIMDVNNTNNLNINTNEYINVNNENNDDKDKTNHKLQQKNTDSSNRSNSKKPTIIKHNQNSVSFNIDNNQNNNNSIVPTNINTININNSVDNNNNNINNSSVRISHKDSVICQVKPETADSRIMCSQQTISRFLNRSYINIVILGGKGVGKSAFVIKFVENIFEKLYIPTIGSEERRKKFSYNTHLYDLNFIVTSGNDYKADYSKAYETVDFFLVFYDVTSKESFEQAKRILRSEVKLFLYSYGQSMTNVFLVGNKIDDSPHLVSEEVAKAFCAKNNFRWFSISVKNNKNIMGMMKTMIQTVDDIAYPN